jgi:hypothetical protein
MNRSRLLALFADRRGSVAVEAAAVLSLLCVASVAAIDGARYMQLTARAERIAASVADMASRSQSLRDRTAFDTQTLPDDTGMFFELARRMAGSPDAETVSVALASLSGRDGGVDVNWTRADGPAAANAAGRFAALGPLPRGATFIAAEVRLPFDAILLDAGRLGAGLPREVAGVWVFRTRAAGLTGLGG